MTSTTFATINHPQTYDDFYDELLAYIKQRFENVESGRQGDSWIWITDEEHKVSVDTFYAMQFEVHAKNMNPLLQSVLDYLAEKYPLQIHDEPIER